MSSTHHYGHAHSHLPVARDMMSTTMVTLTPDMSVLEAVRLLLKHEVSGAPVVDPSGRLVGALSDIEALRVLAAGEFYSDDHREEGTVEICMTTEFRRASPEDDVYVLAQLFVTQPVRRLPVVEGETLIGQVSHRDVLRALEEIRRRRAPHPHYPDYREPSADVGAKRAH